MATVRNPTTAQQKFMYALYINENGSGRVLEGEFTVVPEPLPQLEDKSNGKSK